MLEPDRQPQAFLEIAMATGNHLELNAMLEEALGAYLGTLNYKAAAVFAVEPRPDGLFCFARVYCMPISLQESDAYRTLLTAIPEGVSRADLDSFLARSPLLVSGNGDEQLCIMALPDFGIVAFVANLESCNREVLGALAPLNRKLAQSCIACANNEKLKMEVAVRERSEKSLAESEERLRIILDSVQAGLVIIDAEEHVILDINPQASLMTGYEKEALIGKKCIGLFCESEDGCCPMACQQERVFNAESVVNHCTEGPIPVLTTVTAIELKNRKHFLKSFVDLREIKRAEEEKERLERLLRHSQKMEAIGTLAGGIAHDFNNLLTPILGMAQLCLEDTGDTESLDDNLTEIYSAGMRAKELVNQILAFSHRTDEELLPLKPKTVVRETLKLLRSSLPTTIEIKRNIESDSKVLGVPSQIQQILMNLCTNAAFAMKQAGGVLTVSLTDVALSDEFVRAYPGREPGAYVKLTVSDTGAGIPEEMAESIFEPYFTTKETDEGTGLGLALVHGIVNRHQGIIRFDSRLGKGTTFDIYLPKLPKRDTDPPDKVHDLPTGSESILLVDDELPVVNYGQKLLERLGYRVTVRTSSIEALGLFSKAFDRFDLVISDMTMANMTGDKLAVEMKKIRPDIPVVIFTGYSDHITTESARNLGIEALLYKPIISSDIAVIVRDVLDRKTNA